MLCPPVIRLLGVARNPANGFPARLLGQHLRVAVKQAVREYLRSLGSGLRLMNLPGYSLDFNAAEAIWGWAREEAMGNLCLGSRAAVQERVGSLLSALASRKNEVKRRCRTVLQSRSKALLQDSWPDSQRPANAHPTLALV